jgi:4-amino-4-deoxy-L-arabinose transferase-like glycosyltransferase
MAKLSDPRSRIIDRLALPVLAVAMLFSAGVRWRLREMPLERDEGGMAYIGQLLLQGTPPYQEAYHEKLPGVYLAYAAIMATFGESASGIHLGLMVINLATIALVFLLARDLFDSLTGGLAAASYALLAASPSISGFAAHATHFIAFFGVAATWALWRALRKDKKWLLFLSGSLFAAAFLMKQHGVFLSGFGGLMVLIHYVRRRPFAWRPFVSGLASFAAGVILPYAAICLWLWWAGVFDRFWFWTVTYSRNHVSEITLANGAQIFWQQLLGVAAPNWPLWIAALLGFVLVIRARDAKVQSWFLVAYTAFSFLCLCPGFFFRDHYFIVWLPALAICGGFAGSRWLDFVGKWRPGGQARGSAGQKPAGKARRSRASKAADLRPAQPGIMVWPAAAILLAAAAVGVWQEGDFFFRWTPTQACRGEYGLNPFLESTVIADYLGRHTTPDQRVAVIGSEPQIYFYAKRKAATGHIYCYPLVERQPFAAQMQRELCRQVEAAMPEFLVFVHVESSWWADPASSRFLYQWASHYVQSYYRPVGLADIVSWTHTDYYWDARALTAHPRSPAYIAVYQRKR